MTTTEPRWHRRRFASWVLALALAVATVGPAAAEPAKIRAGALTFGTIQWVLDVVKHHGLDIKEGVELEIVGMGGKGASAVALQGGAVVRRRN